MKKIINGKLYNTETAKELNYFARYGVTDFNHVKETLYQKKNGEFFVYGKGGPLSRWRTCCGDNSWSSGWGIEPLTEKEAREWAEEHLTADEYIEIFGEPEE